MPICFGRFTLGLFRRIISVLASDPPRSRHEVKIEEATHEPWAWPERQSRNLPVHPPTTRVRADDVAEKTVTIKGACFVVDGDTIIIGNARIRLAGIDAPELDHPYGRNAKWALVNLCRGQTVSAVLEGAMSHDRTVATCYLPDGRDLAAEMVKLGLAIDWPKYSGGRYRKHEVHDIRRKLWRCDARQKGLMPPAQ